MTPEKLPSERKKNQKKIIIGNFLAIYKKELQTYFGSPLAYAIATIFWFLTGVLFYVFLQSRLTFVAENYDLPQQFGGPPPPPIDVSYLFLQGFLASLGIVIMVLMPMLSMGLYSEERKRGTLELLATSPITNWAVASGKLLGVLSFFVGIILPPMFYEAIVLNTSNPPFPIPLFLTSHLALILLAASILSLGMFISSLTDSTILAAILTFVLVLLLYLLEGIGSLLGGPLVGLFAHLSLLKHYSDLVSGVINISSLVLFASYIVLGIFLTAQSIETFRFQRS